MAPVERLPGLGVAAIRDVIIEQETGCNEFVQSKCKIPAREKSIMLAVIVTSRKRTAKLHFRESEAIAETISSPGETLQFFAAPGIEKVQLAGATRERRKFNADK